MKDRRDYEHASEIVRRRIRAWDPYDLIAKGAPPDEFDDEFDDEFARIVAGMPRWRGVDDVAEAISAVFSKAFDPDAFAPTHCFSPAQDIYGQLHRAGWLRAD